MISLTIEYPNGESETTSLSTGVFQLGRTADNDVVIHHDTISRVHAELTVSKHDLRIKDLHSSSGTLLNGKSCSFAKTLQSGDNLRLGLVKLTIMADAKQTENTEREEKTRAFQQEELSTVLKDLNISEHQDCGVGAGNAKTIIIGLCCLILALCLYIFMERTT